MRGAAARDTAEEAIGATVRALTDSATRASIATRDICEVKKVGGSAPKGNARFGALLVWEIRLGRKS